MENKQMMSPQKHYALAIAAFLAIPVVTILGVSLAIFINPEIAAGHANYVRNYRLLDGLKSAIMALTFLVAICSWFLTCYFLVKSKRQSIFWSSLAIFGPFGLITISMLADRDRISGDFYQEFIGRLWVSVRIVYELVFFVVVWVFAFWAIDVKRDLIILHQSVATGVPIEKIVAEHEASGGMWAFSEGNEIIFAVVLVYLLWPICFNVVAWLVKTRGAISSG
jgi:hypothetical protein